MKITIVDSAKKKLDELYILEENKNKCIRLFTRPASLWCDASIALTLDESRTTDEIFEVDDYKVVMSKGLAYRLSDVVIRFGGFMNRDSFSVDAETDYDEN